SFKKGRVLSAEDIADLLAAGIEQVVAARLEKGDLGEDLAARRIADAASGAHVAARRAFTGRANLFARAPGVLVVDGEAVDGVNRVNEAVTVATLAPFAVVAPGQMVATVKIIPFAVEAAVVSDCAARAAAGGGLIRVAKLAEHAVGLIQTTLPGTKAAVLDKTRAVMRGRIEGLGSRLAEEVRCAHATDDLVRALAELGAKGCWPLLVVGASAITDRRDVIPAALEAGGGRIEHFGMPVDPGNLLLLGYDGGGVPVVGLPGCARSPKFNGVDMVLGRLLSGIGVSGPDITGMGAGGLLHEMPGRPQPRAADPARRGKSARSPRIAALVLAAGRSTRMGDVNKMLALVNGQPMVVRVAEAVLASIAAPAIVVTGYQADEVRRALAGRDLKIVENPDYAAGLSTSLRRGLAALPSDADGVLVCLGDMPRVTASQIDRLIAAFDPVAGRAICVPTHGGKRGNPVLWGRRFIPEMLEIAGDVGARHLIGDYADLVAEVEMEDAGVLVDIDTPAALKDAEG
ncbi:MAG: molybdopterin-binding/glycosyltransferase family 2 protein, partial [Rhodospirillales bacterium]|nr:molybdopterin-binding/glycosyltransferase family 2 protein [Rhodospirillales bacterium]